MFGRKTKRLLREPKLFALPDAPAEGLVFVLERIDQFLHRHSFIIITHVFVTIV